MSSKKKVVVIGGGTGIFPVITALTTLDVEVKSIVAVSDSGGSTGKIRDEFGFPPVGDMRQSLAALAADENHVWIRKLLLYRFPQSSSLQGHNLGNLLLTALQDMAQSTSKALEIASAVFRLEGEVIPITEQASDIEITYQDGTVTTSEHLLDIASVQPSRVVDMQLVPSRTINPKATEAIVEADYIIIGPGDLYASLMANLVVSGITDAFKKTTATTVYFLNLMTRNRQTFGMTAQDHIEVIEDTIETKLDYVIANNAPIPEQTLKAYENENEFEVIDDLKENAETNIIRADLLANETFQNQKDDSLPRSLLRHDSHKIASVLQTIFKSA